MKKLLTIGLLCITSYSACTDDPNNEILRLVFKQYIKNAAAEKEFHKSCHINRTGKVNVPEAPNSWINMYDIVETLIPIENSANPNMPIYKFYNKSLFEN